ncbi:MAG TPA: dihydrolipoamide acetyltransferase family protein [Actinomycetota bacterium]
MAAERVFAMPDLGEGLEEGEITAWLVAEGDAVVLNQPIVEVETAKATVEIPSPFAGEVARLHGAVGEAIPVGQPLVTFTVATDEQATAAAQVSTPDTAPVATSPAVRKLARELSIDLDTVVGTGAQGRVTADDVRAAAGPAPVAGPSPGAEVSPLTPTRRAIAENITRQAAIPQVTTFRTVDCTALEAFRAELEVSPLPVVVAALASTLATHPALNAAWTAEGVVVATGVNVGIAADTERGLMVPVLRDAQAMDIVEVRDEIRRLAEGARAATLLPDDLIGATIAVSNTGSYGSEAGTPILSPGTAVTLAIGVIEPRALIVDGAVVARSACTLSCTFDHRVLDGAAVGRALTDLVALLEDPDRLGDLPR